MKLKHIKINQPEIKILHISDYPKEDQERWANIQPFKPVKSMEIETTATRTKRSLRRSEGA